MMRRGWHLLQQLRAERWSLARLEAYQLVHLCRLLSVAWRDVPFYRGLMDNAGVRPADITILGDLRKLPIVDKAMMRSVAETERLARPPAGATRIHTSGSRGDPFGFLVDGEYNAWRKSQYLRPYLTNGRRPGQRLLHLTRHTGRRETFPARIGLLPERRVSCTAPAAEQMRALLEYRPQVVQGYASALGLLAQEVRRTGVRVPPLRQVFSDSEVLMDGARRLVEAALGAPVLDVYGSFEADNIAYECVHRRGLHLTLDSVIAEIVDGDRVLEAGEVGELVITVLHNRLMPFIRYRTGDLARLIPDPCPCGRSFPLLQLIGGRRYDMLRLPDGCEASPLALMGSFSDAWAEIVEFRIVQTGLTAFNVQVVPQASLPRTSVETRVRELVNAKVSDAEVAVEMLESIPRTAGGKLLAFSCEVDPP